MLSGKDVTGESSETEVLQQAECDTEALVPKREAVSVVWKVSF